MPHVTVRKVLRILETGGLTRRYPRVGYYALWLACSADAEPLLGAAR